MAAVNPSAGAGAPNIPAAGAGAGPPKSEPPAAGAGAGAPKSEPPIAPGVVPGVEAPNSPPPAGGAPNNEPPAAGVVGAPKNDIASQQPAFSARLLKTKIKIATAVTV